MNDNQPPPPNNDNIPTLTTQAPNINDSPCTLLETGGKKNETEIESSNGLKTHEFKSLRKNFDDARKTAENE